MTRNQRHRRKNRRRAADAGGYVEARDLRIAEKSRRQSSPTSSQRPAGPGRGICVAAISHHGGTGRSTTVRHIGAALAAEGLRVLLLDMDEQSNLGWLCGAALPVRDSADRGADDVLDNDTVMVHRFDRAGTLSVLAGAGRPGSSLNVEWARALLESARERFDVVVVDTAPLAGGLIVDLVDAVFGCANFDPTLVVDHIDATYSEPYRSYRQSLEKRGELLEWLDQGFDRWEQDRNSSEPYSEVAAAALVMTEVAARGRRRFGADRDPGSRRWLDTFRDVEPEIVGVLDHRDPNIDLIEAFDEAAFGDLAHGRQSADDDVVRRISQLPTNTILTNIDKRYSTAEFSGGATAVHHVGLVLTRVDDELFPGIETVLADIAVENTKLLPPMRDIGALADPLTWREWITTHPNDHQWTADRALATTLWHRIDPHRRRA